MNRLMTALEDLPSLRPDLGPFVVQHGYSRPPSGWDAREFLSAREMTRLIADARVVITHGGPATISACLRSNKLPIVVPRLRKFHEHVDDHQLAYARLLAKRLQAVVIEDVAQLAARVTQLADAPPLPRGVDSLEPDAAVRRFAEVADALVLGWDRNTRRGR